MMKPMIVLAALLAATPALADPVEGLWKTRPLDDGNYGYIEIAPCGDRICGILVKAFDSSGAERPSDNIGKKIVWDMVARGDGYYDSGKIWAPDRDKTYNSNMTMQGDSLAVKV